MSAENEAYQAGRRLLREILDLQNTVQLIDASDTGRKDRVLAQLAECRNRLRGALEELAGLV
jgi:hypothetical protein